MDPDDERQSASGAPAHHVPPYRAYSLVAVAIYEATIATWDSKYAYNRPRPSELDVTLKARLPVPASPSYPSEHAAVGAAAAEVLAYLFPAEAESFQMLAELAGKSRLYAGLQYPTDYFAGLELGKAVAAKVIERARATAQMRCGPGRFPRDLVTGWGRIQATRQQQTGSRLY